ncbi:ABC transporter ATP-binding protein/permease [Halomonas sp. ATCH28]|uniref:ABC transporter ATP-binding protein/permease n=1 Tax=Halomonas gemina TaxID=2945105 RepID=A0ABT0T1Y7_9GAMM|nr:ABC transporter ATP-binding protein [Halomonas gemina]MCL7940899.1 ABC transporter ATP-binding protein/permease [Halomonas gemina]
MINSLREFYSLLTREQRKKFFFLQILIVLMSFAELVGVLAIGPFMAIVGDMTRLQGDGLAADLYKASGMDNPTDFLFWVGVCVLVVLTISASISMYTIWRLSMYASKVGAELGNRLFSYYMHQPWIFHATGSSSQLTKQIAQECIRVTNSIITPLMQMNAKVVMAFFMMIAVFFYNPKVAFVGLATFFISYMLLYRIVRNRLMKNGKKISDAQTSRFKIMAEGFGGIKDTLLLGRQQKFTQSFIKSSNQFAIAQGTNQALGLVPRYAMELVAFGSIIFLVLYLLVAHKGNLGTILPVLSVYALAGFKLLPAFQQIYSSISKIRGNLAAFEAIRDELRNSAEVDEQKTSYKILEDEENLSVKSSIVLNNISFRYPGKSEPALDGLSLEIPVNKVIGLVGATGSGKSTAIDLLLGLIEPDSGEILIDGVALTKAKKRAWQNMLGFVPQSIFLSDSSIRENIAFGLPPKEIDEERVSRAAKMAHLNELLMELPHGLDTRVGERGVQLSGGQRQRIGIARALYNDAEILVLDEATSALDGITEKLVMDAIHDFFGKKTIVMIAHRLATVKQCHCIYLIKNGCVVDKGCYEELRKRNDIFQRMVQHA